MTEEEKSKIQELKKEGQSYKAIAKTIDVTSEAVRSFIRRQMN